MIRASFRRLESDYLVFAKNLRTSKAVIVIVYMDNILFFGPNITEINAVKSFITKQYIRKDLEPCSQFTEIKLEQNIDERTISLSQKVYLEKTLEYANISDS